MNDAMLGHVVRTLRVRHGWRQDDLARRARVSRGTVARIEQGFLGTVALERVRSVFAALGSRVDVVARWNGGDLDRLLRSGHSAMHEVVASLLDAVGGWLVAPEVSFSIYGERGVIDVLAWHAATRTLLIIEIKTQIVDVNDLMAKADQRRRLAPRIAAERGWRPATIGVWIVVADGRTNRRRLAAHRSVLRAAFPTDGRTVPGWLRKPAGPLAALSFLPNDRAVNGRTSVTGVRRVRVKTPRTRAAPET